ncbi:hypothetical protein [Deinococcus apachensis]|uniref:hypothetical protein n=1 Tax=Deinococcus apachensis TaxID=309886 RepID=UPI00037F3B9D|nr:hypothetical protein [Deinococcus apachensis]
MDTFETRALQLAIDLTQNNTYEGKMGQGYVEARAADIRRTYNILCGLDPDHRPAAPAPRASGRRKAAVPSASAEL